MVENQGVSEVGDEVRADFRADHGSVRLLNIPNSPKQATPHSEVGYGS
jgi:hypothetical protein